MTWQTTIEALSCGKSVLLTIQTSKGNRYTTFGYPTIQAGRIGFRTQFKEYPVLFLRSSYKVPDKPIELMIIAWQPLPEPYDPNRPNHVDDARGKTANGKTFILGGLREFGSENG